MMARHGKFYKGGTGKGIPKGWCARPPDKFAGKGAGLRMKEVADGSMRIVFYKKFPTKINKGARGATLGVTYGCPKGHWHPKGKTAKKCDGGMRTVQIMKPKTRVMSSKSRRKYKCRKG